MNYKDYPSSDSLEGALQSAIQAALQGTGLAEGESHLVDIVKIPQQQDKMVRVRTIEEILEDFEGDSNENTVGYLVQIKRQQSVQTEPTPPFSDPVVKQMPDGVYLQNGKLNLQFLQKNAELLFSAGEYTLSRNIYQTIRQSGEKTATALQGIASCYEAEGRLEQAATHYEESIAYHATLESYQRLASLLIRKNKNEEAAETYERALQLKDLNSETRFQLHNAAGNCWARAGKTQNAEGHYQKALDINP
ncbi:MAG: tetratricopeptide repeat protein, partial [Bdellovibrionota bacterium]